MDYVKEFLLGCTDELEELALQGYLFSFWGSFILLQFLGRVCFANPSSLLEMYLPERYANDPVISSAMSHLDTERIFRFCINEESDDVKVELIFDRNRHLFSDFTLDIYVDGESHQGVKLNIDASEFVDDLKELIIRIFKHADSDDLMASKLRVAFNTYKLVGLL